jgi:formiminotetrahydrofolate cyclodeaminase
VTGSDAYLDAPIRVFLEQLGERTPAPAGGSVSALVVAMAAGLAEMAARFSTEHWDGAAGAVAQARALRERAAPLALEDAEAYEQALAALRLPKEGDPKGRNRAIGEALERAAAVPLEIASLASSVALLAAELAERGNPNLRGDAAAAAVLAEAVARATANLVVINLGAAAGDERIARARLYVDTASGAARQALAPAP